MLGSVLSIWSSTMVVIGWSVYANQGEAHRAGSVEGVCYSPASQTERQIKSSIGSWEKSHNPYLLWGTST